MPVPVANICAPPTRTASRQPARAPCGPSAAIERGHRVVGELGRPIARASGRLGQHDVGQPAARPRRPTRASPMHEPRPTQTSTSPADADAASSPMRTTTRSPWLSRDQSPRPIRCRSSATPAGVGSSRKESEQSSPSTRARSPAPAPASCSSLCAASTSRRRRRACRASTAAGAARARGRSSWPARRCRRCRRCCRSRPARSARLGVGLDAEHARRCVAASASGMTQQHRGVDVAGDRHDDAGDTRPRARRRPRRRRPAAARTRWARRCRRAAEHARQRGAGGAGADVGQLAQGVELEVGVAGVGMVVV